MRPTNLTSILVLVSTTMIFIKQKSLEFSRLVGETMIAYVFDNLVEHLTLTVIPGVDFLQYICCGETANTDNTTTFFLPFAITCKPVRRPNFPIRPLLLFTPTLNGSTTETIVLVLYFIVHTL